MNSIIRRRLNPSAKRSNFDRQCATCVHGWHGLACNVSTCPCPTSWTEPA